MMVLSIITFHLQNQKYQFVIVPWNDKKCEYYLQCIQLYKKRYKNYIKEQIVIKMGDTSTIRVSIETKKRLNEIGNVSDSYNSVITKLLDEHDKNKK